MAKKTPAAAEDSNDLLAGGDDNPLDDSKSAKPAKGKAAAAKGKPAPAAAKGASKPAKGAPAPAAKGKANGAAKPAAKPAASAAKSARGEGKFFMTAEEKDGLAKKIGTVKKAVSTKELAEKLQVETWKVRRAIHEVLLPAGKGKVEKVGTTLTYTP